VQLQISRVFWLVDVVATVVIVGAVAEASWLTRLGRPALAACLAALAAGRGGYILLVEHPERPLFRVHLEDSPWHEAMRFVATLPKDALVLADSGHAWRYGTSVRVSAARDVFLEETKDFCRRHLLARRRGAGGGAHSRPRRPVHARTGRHRAPG
jgi:hypothetical protein